MNGRDKCELLNEIRQKIAEKNNIEFDFDECTFEGECSGTCPKCESELEYLEMELEKKQEKGEKIELEGIFTLKEREPTEILCKDVFIPFGDFGPRRFDDEDEENTIFETFGHPSNEDIVNLYLKTFIKLMNEGNDDIELVYNDKEYDGDITVFEIKEDEDE